MKRASGIPLTSALLLSICLAADSSRAEAPDREPYEIFPAEVGRRLSQQELSEEDEVLLRRPDQKRPKRQLTTELFGRPLTIGWNYESRLIVEDDIPFKDRREDDSRTLSQRLSVDFFHPLSERTSLYLKGSAVYRSKRQWFDRHRLGVEDARDRRHGVERGEMWLYTRSLWDTPFSLQVGRQRLSEDREWWWDQDLDAVRLHYDLRKLHLEFAAAQELGRVASDAPHMDPEEEDVLRFLGHGTWEWRERNQLEVFFLHQRDRSSTELVGQRVKSSREDENDADLTWAGLSARGHWKLGRPGRLRYWVDTAVVDGRGKFLDYGGRTETRRVDAAFRHSVHGWAFDVGTTFETRLPGRPSFTLGYAVGSGDRRGKDLAKSDLQEASDRSFRPTGLEDANGRFHGVNRFKYYGELLEPDLSNLRIGTASIGFRLLRNSSLELVSHWYRQFQPAKFVRGATIRRQPAGRKHGLGREFDLVLGIEEWEHVEIELIASAFRAGPAFGLHTDPVDRVPSVEGEWSYLLGLKFELNF